MLARESISDPLRINGTVVTHQSHFITTYESEIIEEEQILLRWLAQGDSNAFWRLWERYQNYLYSCCLRWMGGNREDAEDALSSASIKAWNKLPDYAREITNLKGWLTRLTHNLCMDIHRERERHVTLVQEDIEEIAAADREAVAYVQSNSEDTLLRREMCEHIRWAIDALPSRLREPFTLRFYRGMSYRDIAVQLALSIENVRKRIQQTRAILQELLSKCSSVGDAPAWTESGPDESGTDGWKVPVVEACMHKREKEEIKPLSTAIYTVQVPLPAGVEMHFHIFLDGKPTRQHQKVETLRKYVQQHPGGWKKRLELADLLYTMGCWEEAVEAYRQVLEKQPHLIGVCLQLGNILYLMDRGEEAIAAYEHALLFSRKPATQHHLRGLIEVCRRRHEMAARAFEKAVSLEPSNASHWHALGLMYLRADCPVDALRAFNEALKIKPDDLVVLTYSCDALCLMGRFKKALRRMAQVLELDPDNVLTLKRLADSRSAMELVRGEEGKKTRQLIQRTLWVAPDAPDGQESLARYHIFRGEWKKGIAVLQKFTEQRPNCPRGWYHYARWLFRTGESQTTADAIMKAHVLYQNDADIYRAACEILPAAGKLSELQPLLEEMLRRFPERWSVWTTAGLVLAEWFKDGERACTVASRGPQLQPHLADAWFQHGRVLSLAGKHKEAITALAEGWEWLPEGDGYAQSTPAAVWLGESYRIIGDEAKSRAWYEESVHQALELTAINSAIAHYWQGKALEMLGDIPRARQAYRTALRHHLLPPARREVKQTMRSLRIRARHSFLH